MVASEEAAAGTASPRNVCLQTGPFYRRIRPFAIFIRFMATFPLHNITAKDGRELRHKWISGILIYDFFVFVSVGMFFLVTSMQMIEVFILKIY
jgi:Trehalose receptor